jgi:hypothetical protein
MKNRAVFAIVRDRNQAEQAVDALIKAGFRQEDISVLFQDNVGSKDFAHEKHTKAPEGTTAGAVTGGIVGGTLGLLAGIGALAIPGIGPFIAAGPIMGALGGIGAGGVAGGLLGALIGLGMPEYEAKRYEGMVREGRVLISVHCDDGDWVDRAKNTMKGVGAQDISTSGEAGADYAATDKPRARYGGSSR